MKLIQGLVFLSVLTYIYCYNILMATLNSRDHKIVFDAVAGELIKRGHQITMMSSFQDVPGSANVRNVFINCPSEDDSHDNSQKLTLEMDYYSRITNAATNKATATYENPFVKDLIENPRDSKGDTPKFHLLVVDAIYNDFFLPLAHHLGIPSVLLSPSTIYPYTAWYLNIPHYASVIPSPLVEYSTEMDYNARIHNTWVTFRLMHALYFHSFSSLDDITHNVLPKSPSIIDLLGNVSIVLTNTNPAVNVKIMTAPNLVEVGGLHLKPAKQLPQELESYIQNSKNGVIYVSINTTFTLKEQKALVQAFSKVPQNIIWKTMEEIKDVPKNVKLLKAAPQQDLLGSKKLDLFITSGGDLDIHEAVYHECPILGIPFTTRQLQNVRAASDHGFGDFVNRLTLTATDVIDKIKELTTNNRYKTATQKLSKLMKDHPNEPLQTAAFWIEYAIRQNGAHHLKSEAQHLYFFQYFMFDVYGSVVGVIFAILLLVGILVITLTPLLGRPNKDLPKAKKN